MEIIYTNKMSVTVEPGIYIPNLGGVRIEDDVLITKNGLKSLPILQKNLLFCKYVCLDEGFIHTVITEHGTKWVKNITPRS